MTAQLAPVSEVDATTRGRHEIPEVVAARGHVALELPLYLHHGVPVATQLQVQLLLVGLPLGDKLDTKLLPLASNFGLSLRSPSQHLGTLAQPERHEVPALARLVELANRVSVEVGGGRQVYGRRTLRVRLHPVKDVAVVDAETVGHGDAQGQRREHPVDVVIESLRHVLLFLVALRA